MGLRCKGDETDWTLRRDGRAPSPQDREQERRAMDKARSAHLATEIDHRSIILINLLHLRWRKAMRIAATVPSSRPKDRQEAKLHGERELLVRLHTACRSDTRILNSSPIARQRWRPLQTALIGLSAAVVGTAVCDREAG